MNVLGLLTEGNNLQVQTRSRRRAEVKTLSWTDRETSGDIQSERQIVYLLFRREPM